MNSMSGFGSTTSQICQPNCNSNNEKDDGNSGKVSKKKKNSAEQMLRSQFWSRSPAMSGTQLSDHGRCRKLLWLPLTRVTATWADRSSVSNKPLKPSAFHHCTEMTTHLFLLDDETVCDIFYYTAMRCQKRHATLTVKKKRPCVGAVHVFPSLIRTKELLM